MPIPFIVHVHMMYMCVPTHSVDHSMFPIGSVHYENNDYMLKVLNSSEQFLFCLHTMSCMQTMTLSLSFMQTGNEYPIAVRT